MPASRSWTLRGPVGRFAFLVVLTGVLLLPPEAGRANTAVKATALRAGTSAAYTVFTACGRSAGTPRSSRCIVGDRVGAFFRSNVGDTAYTICIRFPTGRVLCADEQPATQGTLYVNAVTTNIVGRHTVTWTVDGIVLEREFFLGPKRRPRPDRPEVRTCGILPGDGAYRYIKTRNVGCRTGMRVAYRARRKFCARHNRCLINPPTPIATVYKGRIRYNGWTCRVKDGWELTFVRCRKRDMRFILRSAA